MRHADPFDGYGAPAPVVLVTLDQTTVRALCDAGYVSSRDYVELAAANGWQADPAIRARAAEAAGPPIDASDLYA
ncbi:hypothetical protein [Methylobacterium sp. CCH5-D2]|uniref:hypothetical protein n=1 Tax=Methylobacterium sp. CCH5-D2 TaxID=1768765 RepID=UPI0008305AB7|nr:hypothetical protein [Methylobacterium sp. CCH5-D2]